MKKIKKDLERFLNEVSVLGISTTRTRATVAKCDSGDPGIALDSLRESIETIKTDLHILNRCASKWHLDAVKELTESSMEKAHKMIHAINSIKNK